MKHIERLLEMSKDGSFKYAGRDTAPDPLIVSGEAAISFGSSSSRGNLVKVGKIRLGRGLPAVRPGDHQEADELDHRRRQPVVMTAPERTPEEYKAVAEFLKYIGKPESRFHLEPEDRLRPRHLRRL